MKNLSKVLAVVLAFAMALSMVSFAAYTDVKAGDNCEEAVTVLSALEILKGYEDGSFKPEATITRAEFATVVIRLLGLADSASATATMFNDVAADHWASGAIALASQQGIVNGYGDGNFGPEDPVKYNEAIKMIVAALGYTPMADANGGWPGGFQVVASQKGILTGISGIGASAEAPRGVVAQLAYNALTVPLMEQTGFGTQTNFATVGSLLLNKLGITKFEASVDGTSLSDSSLKEGEVRVVYNYQITGIAGQSTAKKYDPKDSDVNIYCNPVVNAKEAEDGGNKLIAKGEVEEAAKELIDAAVVVYVRNADSDKPELVSIMRDGSKNEVIEFMSEDVRDYEDNILEVYTDADAGEYEEYTLNINKVYVNGRTVAVADIASTLATYLDNNESADVKLLSQEDDEFNVAYFTDYTDVKVTRIAEKTWKVYYEALTSNTTGVFVLDETDKKQKFQIYKDGEIASFEDIAVDDVLSIAGGYDNAAAEADKKLSYGSIYITSDRVEGKVTGRSVSGGKLAIDGESHKATPATISDVTVGDTAVFFKNIRGVLVAVDKTASAATIKYGFAAYATEYDVDYGTPASVKLLTSEGKWEIIDFADTVVYEGTRTKNKDLAWTDLVDGSTIRYGINKVVAYDLNSAGKVSKLYTVADEEDLFLQENDKPFDGTTGNYGKISYNSDTMMFGEYFLDDETVIFSLASDFEGDAEYPTEEDEVSIVALGSIVDGEEHSVKAFYDNDDAGIAGAVLGVGIATGIDFAQDFFVVSDAPMWSTNEAGEEGIILTGVKGGEEVTLFINTEDDDFTLKAADLDDAAAIDVTEVVATINDETFAKGDVLIYTLNSKGEANEIVRFVSAAAVTDPTTPVYGALGTVDGTTNGNGVVASKEISNSTYKFVYGYAKDVKSGGKVIVKGTGAGTTSETVLVFNAESTGVRYNAFVGNDGGRISEALSGDIETESNPEGTFEEDGDMIFARVLGNKVVDFVVFANND